MTKNSPRILTIDVETLPLEVYAWNLGEQYVGIDKIKTEWSILSYCAKWLDNKKLIYNDTNGRGLKKVRDDKRLCGELWELLNNAELIVAQNGARFDVKKINARLLYNGYGPYSPIRIIDTLTVARRIFGFTSNKLQWLSKNLTDTPKYDHRKFPGQELWTGCLEGNKEAWEEMEVYNKIDTVACEKLYLKLRPWIPNHPNVGAYSIQDVSLCPKCGSDNIQKRGTSVTQNGRFQRYQCLSCSGWSRSKGSLIDTAQKRALLV